MTGIEKFYDALVEIPALYGLSLLQEITIQRIPDRTGWRLDLVIAVKTELKQREWLSSRAFARFNIVGTTTKFGIQP